MHWAFLLLLRVPQSLLLRNSPTAWSCYQHTLLLGWYSAGDAQCWLSFNDAWNWGSSDQRILFLRVCRSFRCFFCKFQVCFHVSSLRRRTSLAIKPRSVESCSDVCPSLGFSYLHIWSWSSTRVTIRFLVTTLTKALLHQLLRLDKRPALGRILLVSNLRVPETTCDCDPSMKQNYFLNSSPDELFPTHFI